jgi:hypothetical protein
MEHPANQIETAMEGAEDRRARAAADQLAMPRQKKLKAFNFRLADPQSRLFAVPQRERSPQNGLSSSSRDSLFQPFRWRAFPSSSAGFEQD